MNLQNLLQDNNTEFLLKNIIELQNLKFCGITEFLHFIGGAKK